MPPFGGSGELCVYDIVAIRAVFSLCSRPIAVGVGVEDGICVCVLFDVVEIVFGRVYFAVTAVGSWWFVGGIVTAGGWFLVASIFDGGCYVLRYGGMGFEVSFYGAVVRAMYIEGVRVLIGADAE